jgi:hypothetical protein
MEQVQPKTYIEVLLRRVYGNERFYPASQDAKVLCDLLKAHTLTKEQLKLCKESGWGVVIKTEEYNLDE